MKVVIPQSLDLIIDSNEQDPLLFPDQFVWWRYPDHVHTIRLNKIRERLPFGDYAFKGLANVACVERKGCLSEINKNLLSRDRRRANAAFRKLVEGSKHPFLWLDFTIGMALNDKYVDNPSRTLDILYHYAASRGLSIIWAGPGTTTYGRTMAGEQVVRLLWNTIWHEAELAAVPGGPK